MGIKVSATYTLNSSYVHDWGFRTQIMSTSKEIQAVIEHSATSEWLRAALTTLLARDNLIESCLEVQSLNRLVSNLVKEVLDEPEPMKTKNSSNS